MARSATSGKFTYEQMAARKREILEQSPWLADYEVEALLTDEGYNVYEDAPDGYEEPEFDYNDGTEVVGTESVPAESYTSSVETPAAQPGESVPAAAVPVAPAPAAEIPDFVKAEQEKRAREIRTKAAKLLRKNIAKESGRMGMALLSFIIFQVLICGLIAAYLLLISGYKESEINSFLTDPTNMLIIQGIILVIGLGLPFVLYIYILKVPIREAVPFRKNTLGDTLRMTFIGLGFCGTISYIENAIVQGTIKTGGFYNNQIVLAESRGIGLVLSIFCIGILPALLEEFVFRGVILQILRRRGGDTFAIVMSAVMCALIYSNYKGISCLLISLLIGYLAVFSGSLLPGIIISLIRNLLTLTVTLMGTRVNPTEVSYINGGLTILFMALAIFSLPGMLSHHPDFFRIKKDSSSLTLGEKLKVGLSRPSMLIIIVYAIFFTVIEFIPTEKLIEGLLK